MEQTPQFVEITPNDWGEAKAIWNLIGLEYVYRGQSDSAWHLETSLKRATDSILTTPQNLYDIEKQILRIFKNRAHHYIQTPPSDKDYIEWLSLIQDHGGPSRLLDFSESFYVASFFASESVKEVASVWAISQVRLFAAMIWGNKGEYYRQLFGDKISGKTEIYSMDYGDYIGEANRIIRFAESFVGGPKHENSLVLKVAPPRLNERLAVQKGVFLFPCNFDETFEKNLCSTFELSFDDLGTKNATKLSFLEFSELTGEHKKKMEMKESIPLANAIPIIKINLTKDVSFDALADLYNMNIDYASLFPGLDGFTKSLHFQVVRGSKLVSRYSFPIKGTENAQQSIPKEPG